jgi:hypothetical protein
MAICDKTKKLHIYGGRGMKDTILAQIMGLKGLSAEELFGGKKAPPDWQDIHRGRMSGGRILSGGWTNTAI